VNLQNARCNNKDKEIRHLVADKLCFIVESSVCLLLSQWPSC